MKYDYSEQITTLTGAQKQDIRKEICYSLQKDTDDADDLYEMPQLEEVMALEKKLIKQGATIEQYIKEFEKFYSGYAY